MDAWPGTPVSPAPQQWPGTPVKAAAPAPAAEPDYLKRNQPWVQPGAHTYNTPLDPKSETGFRKWVQDNKVPFDPGKAVSDYDMRGFYKALTTGDKRAKSAVDPNDKRLHYPDYWKTPYHETFSAESQWANPKTAPHWNSKDQLVTPDGKVVYDDRAPKKKAAAPGPAAEQWPGQPVDAPAPAAPKPPGFLQDAAARTRRLNTEAQADFKVANAEHEKQPWDTFTPQGAVRGLRAAGDLLEGYTPLGAVGGAGEAAYHRLRSAAPANEIGVDDKGKVVTRKGDVEKESRLAGMVAETALPVPAFAKAAARPAEAGRSAAAAFQSGEAASKEAVRAVKRLMAPATVSAQSAAAAGTIRRARGESRLAADQSAHALIKAQKAAGNQPAEWHRSLINFVENRGKGGRPPDAAEYRAPKGDDAASRLRAKTMATKFDNTDTAKAANTLRDVYRHWQARAEYAIRRNKGAAPQFVKDYYAHIWKEDPERVKVALDNFYKQGSGRNFRRRSIPTIEEGLKAGLTPKYENAFETTQHYVDNMSRFLATHDIQGSLKEAGHASWHLPGTQPEGWVPLNGIMTERVPKRAGGRPGGPKGDGEWPGQPLAIDGERAPRRIGQAGPEVLPPETPPERARIGKYPGTEVDVRTKNVTPDGKETPPAERPPDVAPTKQLLYAHPDVARVYNNFVSKGLAGTQIGPLYKAVQATTNATKLVAFGLSWAHLGLVGQEGILSEIAGAIRSASRAPAALASGDVGRAAAHMREAGGSLARAPIAPFQQYAKGRKFSKQLLEAGTPEGVTDPLHKAFARSGNQLHMADVLKTRGAGSFFQSIQRGSLGKDAAASLRRVIGPDKNGAWDRTKGAADFVGNVVQSLAAPMMEHFIPHAKQGAWLNEMERWVKANPAASQAEIDAQGMRVTDSIDNRMGEMLQDNLFWHKWIKEVSQIALQSYSFTAGTVRELAGGVKDIPESIKGVASGKGISPRTAYAAALAAYVPARNALYQYLKTGKAPQGQDFVSPQTGGHTPDGEPERAGFLGNEKDVYGYSNDVAGELTNKQSGELQFGEHLLTGKDWRGLPIAPPEGAPHVDGEPDNIAEAFADDFASSFTPFALANQRRKQGSNISGLERSFGVRPAPAYMAHPDRYKMQKRAREMRAWTEKINADKKAEAQMEQP